MACTAPAALPMILQTSTLGSFATHPSSGNPRRKLQTRTVRPSTSTAMARGEVRIGSSSRDNSVSRDASSRDRSSTSASASLCGTSATQGSDDPEIPSIWATNASREAPPSRSLTKPMIGTRLPLADCRAASVNASFAIIQPGKPPERFGRRRATRFAEPNAHCLSPPASPRPQSVVCLGP